MVMAKQRKIYPNYNKQLFENIKIPIYGDGKNMRLDIYVILTRN